MNLLIIGAGGHGKCCYEIAERMNMFDQIDFVDDHVQYVMKKEVKGTIEKLKCLTDQYDCAFVAIGDNKTREMLNIHIQRLGYKRINLIDPSSFTSKYCSLGEGIVIFPNASIEVESIIKDGCIISSNSIIHHNSLISEYSLVYGNCIVRPTTVVKPFTMMKSGTIFEGGN